MLYNHSLTDLHVELTDKCNAACPQCPRTDLQTGRESELVFDVSLDPDLLLHRIRQLPQLRSVMFCGNYGDPVMHPDLLHLSREIRKMNKWVIIHTNGGLRPVSWWSELGEIIGSSGYVAFALDGATKESHEQYRVNTSFDRVLENAQAFIKAGGRASWRFLEFDHNADEFDEAFFMSKEMGFRDIHKITTNRFTQTQAVKFIDRKGNERQLASSSTQRHILPSDSPIRCDVSIKKSYQSTYIDSEGYVFPCCWVAAAYRKQKIGRKDQYSPRIPYPWDKSVNINTARIGDIIKHPFFDDIEKSFTDNPLYSCVRFCGKRDQKKVSEYVQNPSQAK